ncbi:tamavidin1 [Mycena pura]|uniref:Tamavidin1 n=1 Tax=Mycena pura TaxID=153505 RepID=A0AAD6VPV4_9AGAR|nr:tamavidin1 [Mycena pura]
MLSGVWYNQLGSQMTLIPAQDSGLTGLYTSAVGEADDVYVLAGRFDDNPPADPAAGLSIGWVVTYRNDQLNAHCTATWSGQFFVSPTGEERIVTHWLLALSTEPSAVWNSTNIGHDTFTRTKPSAAAIAQAHALTVGSPHPAHVLRNRTPHS